MTKEAPGIQNMVTGCKKNDIYSKELMYRALYGYVMGVIIRYVQETADAQELVNDTFLKIFKHIPGFEGPPQKEAYDKSFRGWIAKIASRTAIDHLRKNKNSFVTSELEKSDYHLVSTPVTTKMEIDDILQLLDQLPPTHKLVFNMYEVEGYSHEEIAKILKISVSSSRVFLTRAKSKLRVLYEDKFSEC